MSQEQSKSTPSPPPPPSEPPFNDPSEPPTADPPPSTPLPLPSPPLSFDPSRMIGIIKRKALIKELAAVYHAECLAYCQELLELQGKWEEPLIDTKTLEDMRKEMGLRLPKRVKKSR